MNRLYTIGYEGAALHDFIETLSVNNVNVLVDVRERPTSRRRGFARTALRQALALAGIGYRHERALGCPKPIRDDLKRDRNYETFFRRYAGHLAENDGLLDELSESLKGNVALLCYERDPAQCHRRAVAAALAQRTGIEPIHLGVQRG